MSENTPHIIHLPQNIPIYVGRQTFVIEYAAGKNVLHLGCVDEGLTAAKFEQGMLLHEHLSRVASSLWGIDIDPAGLDWMRSRGYPNLYLADIENLADVPGLYQQSFDLIVLAEVIEHLDNPGRFLQSVGPLMRPETELLITTPNASSLLNLQQIWRNHELCHPDHNYWFSYRTLTGLLTKFGFTIEKIAVYSQHNFRRSIRAHLMGKLRPSRDEVTPLQGEPAFSARNSPARPRHPRLLGWLNATMTTLSYRLLLARSPFFADGLIVIAKKAASGSNPG